MASWAPAHSSDLDWVGRPPIPDSSAVRRRKLRHTRAFLDLTILRRMARADWAGTMVKRRNFRLWWPSNLFSQTPPNSSFVFGWSLPSSEDSVDVVVAFACDERELASSLNSGLDLLVRCISRFVLVNGVFSFLFMLCTLLWLLMGLDLNCMWNYVMDWG